MKYHQNTPKGSGLPSSFLPPLNLPDLKSLSSVRDVFFASGIIYFLLLFSNSLVQLLRNFKF